MFSFLDVSVSVDNSGNTTTDLYIKPTDTQQYLMATSCHPNHTKRSMPYGQALRILRICSSKESAKLRCTELVDCLVKRGYNKRKTNKQIERASTNFANPPTGRQCHTARPVYFNVQFHPSSSLRHKAKKLHFINRHLSTRLFFNTMLK